MYECLSNSVVRKWSESEVAKCHRFVCLCVRVGEVCVCMCIGEVCVCVCVCVGEVCVCVCVCDGTIQYLLI